MLWIKDFYNGICDVDFTLLVTLMEKKNTVSTLIQHKNKKHAFNLWQWCHTISDPLSSWPDNVWHPEGMCLGRVHSMSELAGTVTAGSFAPTAP